MILFLYLVLIFDSLGSERMETRLKALNTLLDSLCGMSTEACGLGSGGDKSLLQALSLPASCPGMLGGLKYSKQKGFLHNPASGKL